VPHAQNHVAKHFTEKLFVVDDEYACHLAATD
jgi:hypothetical protein